MLASHEYSRFHIVAGYQLHGGFDAQGNYVSPRSLYRLPAICAWTESLMARGGTLLDCSSLLQGPHYPTVAQQKFLLSVGVEQSLWNSITRSGLVEADGVKFASLTAPDFQEIVEEDLSNTATAHLNRGLLLAHGLDEGERGHDLMWLAIRDLLFGRNRFPEPCVPARAPRSVQGQVARQMPLIPEPYEKFLLLLMEVLMFEVLAENFFDFCTTVLEDPATFTDRKDGAIHAVQIINHIRQDERLHVGYLNLVLSELRTATFHGQDGTRIKAAKLIDDFWVRRLAKRAARNRRDGPERMQQEIAGLLLALPDGADQVESFNRLGDVSSG
jgi:hypothetical protein